MLARLWRSMLEAACRSVSLQRGQMLSGRQPPALSKAFVVLKRVTVQRRSNTKVVQHQPSKPEQGRHADLDRMLICRRSARKADVYCSDARCSLVCYVQNATFQQKNDRFLRKDGQNFLRGAPPRTPPGLRPGPRSDRTPPSPLRPRDHPEGRLQMFS